ncbi:hypothetical protein [Bradyrhizobium sp. 180]|uniref:hypothetical protein n=1 Tax=Bradyrhizobium sp. 180 TaxID=2782650 RepID=UPI001FF86D08|nr:hypothetical protein [Bradyrhizobium sp. 180]
MPLATPEPPSPASAPAPVIRKGETSPAAPSTQLAASGHQADIAASYRSCGKEA